MFDRWDSLVASARDMMGEIQLATFARFGLDFSMQYKWDLDQAQMIFSSKGAPIVRADLQCLGTIRDRDGSWVWGWADRSIPPVATKRLNEIRTYGQVQGFPKLTKAEWTPQCDDGHDVMIVSACILGAQAFFHDHSPHFSLYFILDNFERIADAEGNSDSRSSPQFV